MGDAKNTKKLCEEVDSSIQYFYRYKKVKELRPDLAERLKRGEKLSLAKAYQEATGRVLKTKRTVCLDPIESQKLELAKKILDLNYSEMLKLGLKCLYKNFEIDFEEG